jgi:hypothetical protein
MAERCSHVQCGAPATARVAFDALARFVWIDRFEADGPRDVSARGAGALCTRHADRLVPPRGWAVQDRRGHEIQLWSDRPPVASVAPVAVAPVAAPPVAVAAADIPHADQPLPFGEPVPSDIEELLVAPRGTLLARAFNAAHTRQTD